MEGTLTAQKLVVTGRFVGTATCEEVEILAGGRVVGQMSSKVLVIERGSFFEGESKLLEAGAREKAGEGEDALAGQATATVTRLPEPVRLKGVPAQEAAAPGS